MEENARLLNAEPSSRSPRKIWNEVIRIDLKERKASKNQTKDSNALNTIRNCLPMQAQKRG